MWNNVGMPTGLLFVTCLGEGRIFRNAGEGWKVKTNIFYYLNICLKFATVVF